MASRSDWETAVMMLGTDRPAAVPGWVTYQQAHEKGW